MQDYNIICPTAFCIAFYGFFADISTNKRYWLTFNGNNNNTDCSARHIEFRPYMCHKDRLRRPRVISLHDINDGKYNCNSAIYALRYLYFIVNPNTSLNSKHLFVTNSITATICEVCLKNVMWGYNKFTFFAFFFAKDTPAHYYCIIILVFVANVNSSV